MIVATMVSAGVTTTFANLGSVLSRIGSNLHSSLTLATDLHLVGELRT
jgi:hypothetical protein